MTDDDIQRTVSWLRDHAKILGTLTEEARLAEHMTKHVLANEMRKIEGTVALQEREAKATTAYAVAFHREASTAGLLAEARALRETAILRVEVWRSQQANMRANR